MASALRGLTPLSPRKTVRRSDTTLLFWCAALAVTLQMTLSANVLGNLGVTPFTKINPATYVLFCGALYALLRGVVPFSQRLRNAPMEIVYLCGIPALIAYSICFVGTSGASVYIETFWSAGLLAFVMESATDQQKRALGRILLGLVVLNSFVGLYESIMHVELFPVVYDQAAAEFTSDQITRDFRAHAFYVHPLSASLITSLAFYLLYQMRLRFILAAPCYLLLLVALLAYGGRSALAITVAVGGASVAYQLLSGIIHRNLKLSFVLSILAGAIIIPAIIAVIITQTTIADRIIDNMYLDGSAEVRATQWDVYSHLNLQAWLFGISKENLEILKFQIGLGAKDTDIENFWILINLDLGIIGFTAFCALFLGFLVHMARRAGTVSGWLLVAVALIIDSSSNSLGVWTNDLLLEVAFLVAISGYRNYVPSHEMPRVARMWAARTSLRLRQTGLSAEPGPLRAPGLQGVVARHSSATPLQGYGGTRA